MVGLGWFWAVMGVLGLMVGPLLAAVILGPDANVSQLGLAEAVLLGLVFLVAPTSMVVAGAGLIRMKPWGRILALVVSAFALPMLPVTPMGAWGLATLLSATGRRVFEPDYAGIRTEPVRWVPHTGAVVLWVGWACALALGVFGVAFFIWVAGAWGAAM